jgi:hypothetical protein
LVIVNEIYPLVAKALGRPIGKGKLKKALGELRKEK